MSYLTSSEAAVEVEMALLGGCTTSDLGWEVQLHRTVRLERAVGILPGVVDDVVEIADERNTGGMKEEETNKTKTKEAGWRRYPVKQVLRDIRQHCEAACKLPSKESFGGRSTSPPAWDRAMGLKLGPGESTAQEMGLAWQQSARDECREMLAWWDGMAGLEETLASLQLSVTLGRSRGGGGGGGDSIAAIVVDLASGLQEATE